MGGIKDTAELANKVARMIAGTDELAKEVNRLATTLNLLVKRQEKFERAVAKHIQTHAADLSRLDERTTDFSEMRSYISSMSERIVALETSLSTRATTNIRS